MNNQDNFIVTKSNRIIVNGKPFNLNEFKGKLQDNVNRLNDINSANILERGINFLSGKSQKVIIESLDINNQFMEFSTFVYEALLFSAKDSKAHRDIIQNKIDEREEKINQTEKELLKIILELTDAIETMNELREKINIYTSKITINEIEINGLKNKFTENNMLINQQNDSLTDVKISTLNNSVKIKKINKQVIILLNAFIVLGIAILYLSFKLFI